MLGFGVLGYIYTGYVRYRSIITYRKSNIAVSRMGTSRFLLQVRYWGCSIGWSVAWCCMYGTCPRRRPGPRAWCGGRAGWDWGHGVGMRKWIRGLVEGWTRGWDKLDIVLAAFWEASLRWEGLTVLGSLLEFVSG